MMKLAPAFARRLRPLPVTVLAVMAASIVTSACQTTPVAHSGYLSSYEGIKGTAGDGRAPRERRDDKLSDAIGRVYIEPSVLRLQVAAAIGADEQAMVRYEVDRQVCYEVSERFDLAPSPEPGAGVIRTAIVGIEPTGRAGSAASAVARFLLPVPLVSIRVPTTTGGLAVESELLDPDGRQAAAITWSRSAEVIGGTEPSLSPVGDALQLAEPLGDAIGDAFSSSSRAERPIPRPDPCARFGPRQNASRFVGSRLIGITTGLYVPSVAGTGRPASEAETGREVSPPR